ncbi:hypothetical protein MML48_3g00001809 [Holotrichia oblita]|uniref:Uncharacterized protein n=1 Tax=Holotrichia oblita TaxID=644536 RepID=A0ACB9THS3_HOLOL|nr:hypothetical protein MML48_3g00001809 [Holotrichia oblita]
MNARHIGSIGPTNTHFPKDTYVPIVGKKNGPPGSIYKCSKTGWINEDLFRTWLKHFAQFVHVSVENKILLVLDNHSTHCSAEAYEFCRENGVIMVSLPPHTSHRLQPLDVVFCSPLKAAFKRECDFFMKCKNLVKITPYDVADLFNKAYSSVATIAKATSESRSTGIHPLNPGIFTDDDILVEDILQNNDSTPVCMDIAVSSHDRPDEVIDGRPNEPTATAMSTATFGENQPTSIEVISPLPGCSFSTNGATKGARPKQHSEILTSTPTFSLNFTLPSNFFVLLQHLSVIINESQVIIIHDYIIENLDIYRCFTRK